MKRRDIMISVFLSRQTTEEEEEKKYPKRSLTAYSTDFSFFFFPMF
jgi:hypothetical protein